MFKLSIAIRMRRAFQSLGICLQAITQLVQQLGHQAVVDAVTATAGACREPRLRVNIKRPQRTSEPPTKRALREAANPPLSKNWARNNFEP
jgi:hypothetical protein